MAETRIAELEQRAALAEQRLATLEQQLSGMGAFRTKCMLHVFCSRDGRMDHFQGRALTTPTCGLPHTAGTSAAAPSVPTPGVQGSEAERREAEVGRAAPDLRILWVKTYKQAG